MSVERIDRRFAQLKAQGRAGFIAYVMAGDPDAETALAVLRGLPAAGADLIELGFPFSDPMAEGPTIQLASQRALKGGMTLRRTLETVRAFREGSSFLPLIPAKAGTQAFEPALEPEGSPPSLDPRVREDEREEEGGQGDEPIFVRHDEPVLNKARDPEPMLTAHRPKPDADTPVILMGYLNPLLTYGYERFAGDAAEAGVDGLIVVDCPPEEAGPLADALDAHGLALIRLATPTSDDARLKTIAARTSGFVYYVSVAGVTGVKEADADVVAPAVKRVRAASGLPVAVGFGIRTPERAAEVARVADAAVVGSALVEEIAAALEANADPAPRVLARVRALADAVHAARSPAAAPATAADPKTDA